MPEPAPQPHAPRTHAVDAPHGCVALPMPVPAPQSCPGSREPLSAQTTGPLLGTPDQATSYHAGDSDGPGLACPLVRLAPGVGPRPTSDVDPLAWPGISCVLAVDIATWTSTDPGGLASAHPPGGPRQPIVGRGPGRQRTLAQAGPAGLTAHRAQVSPVASGPRWVSPRLVATLADLCPQSYPGDHRVRLLPGGEADLSSPLRFCGDGTCHPPRPARQCDGAPDGPMDTATVS
jgi:hypothetical protein